MSLYLQHYFDPDMDQRQLKPHPEHKKNLHNLNFVQNVHEGQLLAQLLPLSSVEDKEARYVLTHDRFPMGENTHVDPENPHRLLASKKGYVTYEDEKICVKTVLKVPSDVSFQTGNIICYADTAISGNVRAGFEVHGRNVLIHGMVEGGTIRAQKNIVVTGGVRGAVNRACMLKAQQDIRLGFAEKAELQAQGLITIEKNCMHSTLYAANNTLIKGRLTGGTVHGRLGVFVKEQIGNKAATTTRIFLGYNPMHIRKLEKIDVHLKKLAHDLRHLSAVAGHLSPKENELARKLFRARRKNATLLKARSHIWERLQLDEAHMQLCKVIALGDVFPGVEIAIGQTYLQVDKHHKNVVFSLAGDEIVCTPYTPAKKHD